MRTLLLFCFVLPSSAAKEEDKKRLQSKVQDLNSERAELDNRAKTLSATIKVGWLVGWSRFLLHVVLFTRWQHFRAVISVNIGLYMNWEFGEVHKPLYSDTLHDLNTFKPQRILRLKF